MLKVPRFRVSLRDLFGAVLIVAIGLAVGSSWIARPDVYPPEAPGQPIPLGLIEGVLTGCGLALVSLTIRRGVPRSVRIALGFAAALVLWFAAVDVSRESHWCQRCGTHYWSTSARFFRRDIFRIVDSEHTSRESLYAAHLGVPCAHDYHDYQWTRLWGIIYPYPRGGCTCCLHGGGEPTEEQLRLAVEKLAREDPGLPQEYRRRVLEERDEAYLTAFRARLRAELARSGEP